MMKEEDIQKTLEKLGARMRELRIKNGFTNYENFAFTHGISRAQYGRYENGRDIRFSTLLRVVEALDMSLKDFFAEGFDED